jgi:hypothetical protein
MSEGVGFERCKKLEDRADRVSLAKQGDKEAFIFLIQENKVMNPYFIYYDQAFDVEIK